MIFPIVKEPTFFLYVSVISIASSAFMAQGSNATISRILIYVRHNSENKLGFEFGI